MFVIQFYLIKSNYCFILVQEGAFLYENNINPYSGDLYHENPLILYASNFLIRNAAPIIPYLFVGCDLLCAFLLFRMAKDLIAQMVSKSYHIFLFYRNDFVN